jgi:cobalt-zinc-cadmium efflux system outer membrane protein
VEAPSPPGGGLDPDQAVAYALLNNPELRAFRKQRRVAENVVVSVSAWENPQLNFDLRIPLRLDLGLRIFPPLPGERAAKIAGAKAEVRRVLAEIEERENALAAEVRTLHAELLMLADKLAIDDAAQRLHRRLADLVGQRVQHAAAPKIDLVLAGMKINQVEMDRQKLLARRDVAQAELAARLGVPGAVALPIRRGRALAPATQRGEEALEDHALAARPDLRVLKEEYEQREQELQLAELAKIPWPRYVQPGVFNLPNRTGAQLTGAVTLPIFNQNEGPIAVAEAQREIARDAYVSRLSAMRSEIRIARLALSAEERRLRYFEETMRPAIADAERAIEEALDLAEGDPLKLGTAMVRIFDVRSEAADAAFAHQKAAIQLELVTGTVLAR